MCIYFYYFYTTFVWFRRVGNWVRTSCASTDSLVLRLVCLPTRVCARTIKNNCNCFVCTTVIVSCGSWKNRCRRRRLILRTQKARTADSIELLFCLCDDEDANETGEIANAVNQRYVRDHDLRAVARIGSILSQTLFESVLDMRHAMQSRLKTIKSIRDWTKTTTNTTQHQAFNVRNTFEFSWYSRHSCVRCRSPLAWRTTLAWRRARLCVCVRACAAYDESFALDLQFALIWFRKSLT